MIELVDFNEIYGKGKGEAKEAAGKRTRRAGGRKKAAGEGAEAAPAKKATKDADTRGEKEEVRVLNRFFP